MQYNTTVAQTVDQDQLDQLMRITPEASVTAAIGAVVIALSFGEINAQTTLAIWLAVFVSVSAARVAAAMAYLRQKSSLEDSCRWFRWSATGTMAHAVLWSLLCVILSSAGDALDESILHVVIAAVAMGAAVHSCSFSTLRVGYTVAVLVPLVIRDVWIGGSYHMTLAALTAMVGVHALLNSRNQSLAITEILHQRRRNAELIDDLQRENSAANEARRLAEQASQAKARLFAAANHDLRQPLHAVTLLTQTLQGQRSLPQARETAARIGECVDNLAQLVDAMLELSQLDSGAVTPQPSHFRLDELLGEIAHTYEPLARAKGLRFAMQSSGAVVCSDRRLLTRVFSNLVANAVRYTATGSIELRVALDGGDAVRIAVVDTGQGINAAELPRIFEEFYQVANRARDRRLGLGLGLSTVRRLSDLLSLDLRVESEPGRGSEFSVRLPLGHAAAIETESSRASEEPLYGRRLLVIEDDADSREALSALLRQWQCEVRATERAAEALEWVDAGYRPEAVIADFRLSEPMSGAEAIRALRASVQPRLPALLVTGDVPEHVKGTDDLLLLRKPVKPIQLRAFLNRAFADLA